MEGFFLQQLNLEQLETGFAARVFEQYRNDYLLATKHGIKQTFAEIGELAKNYKFADCQHQSESGCQVQQAISQGLLNPRRLISYMKLPQEQRLNATSIAESVPNSVTLVSCISR